MLATDTRSSIMTDSGPPAWGLGRSARTGRSAGQRVAQAGDKRGITDQERVYDQCGAVAADRRYAEGPIASKRLSIRCRGGAQMAPRSGQMVRAPGVVHCADSETNSAMRVRYLLGRSRISSGTTRTVGGRHGLRRPPLIARACCDAPPEPTRFPCSAASPRPSGPASAPIRRTAPMGWRSGSDIRRAPAPARAAGAAGTWPGGRVGG